MPLNLTAYRSTFQQRHQATLDAYPLPEPDPASDPDPKERKRIHDILLRGGFLRGADVVGVENSKRLALVDVGVHAACYALEHQLREIWIHGLHESGGKGAATDKELAKKAKAAIDAGEYLDAMCFAAMAAYRDLVIK